MTTETDATAVGAIAQQLDIPEERVPLLKRALEGARRELGRQQAEVTFISEGVEPDLENEGAWRLPLGVDLVVPGVHVQMNFWTVVKGDQWFHSPGLPLPDWFRVETETDGLLFEGEVTKSEARELGGAYELFASLRYAVNGVANARVRTGRPLVVDELEPDETLQLAAEELGIDEGTAERMLAAFEQLYLRGTVSINSYQKGDPDDKGSRECWIGGAVWTDDANVARFRFGVCVDADERVWRGSCEQPDSFQVMIAGELVFQGDLEPPRTEADKPGWARYDFFKILRGRAEEVVNSRLMLGVSPVDDLTAPTVMSVVRDVTEG